MTDDATGPVVEQIARPTREQQQIRKAQREARLAQMTPDERLASEKKRLKRAAIRSGKKPKLTRDERATRRLKRDERLANLSPEKRMAREEMRAKRKAEGLSKKGDE